MIYNKDSMVINECLDGEPVAKAIFKDNKYYGASYDGTNTFIAVQEGENLAAIAEKFNCTIEDLKALNPDLKGNLKAGTSIKIPGILEPDDPKLQGRKSGEQIESDISYRQQLQKYQENLRAQAQRKAYGQNVKAAMSKTGYAYKIDYSQKKQSITVAIDGKPSKMTLIRVATGSNGKGETNIEFFTDPKTGKMYARDLSGSSTKNRVAVPLNNKGYEQYNKSNGYTIYSEAYGRLAALDFKDGMAHKCVDKFGNIYYMNYNGGYELRPQGNNQAMCKITTALSGQMTVMQSRLDELIDNKNSDMWNGLAEFVWKDGVGSIAHVQRKVDDFKKKLSDLNEIAQSGDETAFKQKFHSVFGKPYNQKLVEDALKPNSTEQQKKAAFGNQYGSLMSYIDAAATQQTTIAATLEYGTMALTLGEGTAIETISVAVSVSENLYKNNGNFDVIDFAVDFGAGKVGGKEGDKMAEIFEKTHPESVMRKAVVKKDLKNLRKKP